MTTPAVTDAPAADAALAAVLARHGAERHALLQMLIELQAAIGWLPRPVREALARAVGLTPAVVEGVATFYRFLHLQPVGRTHLLWSDNVSDRFAGSRALAADLCARLGIAPGTVSADGAVSVGFTSCTGLPDQGPALLVNHHQVLTRMDAPRVARLAELIRAGVPVAQWPADWQRVDDQVRQAGPLLGSAPLQGQALRATLARGDVATLGELRAAQLRGRGGAGFVTADKWDAARRAPRPEGGTRVVVCNADEGEPGTFKDRVLLSRHAHTVFEAMTVAARVIGAGRGFVYLRGEYRFLRDALEAVLAQRRAAGLLGRGILGVAGFDFDIAIHLGAGAYVCGEESALLESLEGKRGNPRIRPPYPVERGYLGQPTVVNNVETLCAAALIAWHGAAWWCRQGLADGDAHGTGTRLHAVSGDVERPGVYEFPLGCTVQQILDAAGARRVQAVQVGGPSGSCVAPHEFGRRIGLAADDLKTAGAFTVFDDTRDLFEVAHGYSQFFAHESCGFCTPCRVGTELIARRLDKLAAGFGSVFDEAELRELEAVLHGTTHCGLGGTAANPLRDTLARFPQAYQRRLQQPRFVPAFDLDAELEPARRATGRDDPQAHLARIG